jgi:hypothetical protein
VENGYISQQGQSVSVNNASTSDKAGQADEPGGSKVGAAAAEVAGWRWTPSRLLARNNFNRSSKAAEPIQLASGTLNRYLLILKRLIFESRVRAGSPSFVAAPDGPEIRP